MVDAPKGPDGPTKKFKIDRSFGTAGSLVVVEKDSYVVDSEGNVTVPAGLDPKKLPPNTVEVGKA